MVNQLPLTSQSRSHKGCGLQFSVLQPEGEGLAPSSLHPNLYQRCCPYLLGVEIGWLETEVVHPSGGRTGEGVWVFFACIIMWELRPQNPNSSFANSIPFHSL